MSPRPRPFARTMLAAQSDERLVGLLREGHEQAFDEIVRRYRGPLVAFATAIVGHSRAEDAVQTGLEKAHRALLADGREINLRPWLFAIVRNGSLNLIRSEPATGTLDPSLPSPAPDADPELTAERNEEMERLVTAICALPSAQREALVRRELEGVGHGEIAAQLGTTATAVRGLIFRARTQLRNAVGALVPLPFLRAVLAQGSAAGAAGGGASAALLGGAGAKGGAAAVAAVLALGAGIAIQQRHGGGNSGDDVAVAKAAGPSPRATRDGGRHTTSNPAEIGSGGGPGRTANEAGSDGGDRGSGPDAPAGNPAASPGAPGSGNSSGSAPASSGGSPGDDGPSGGDAPEIETPDPPEVDDSGGSDDTGDEVEVEDPPEPADPPEAPDESDSSDDHGGESDD